MGYCFMTIEKVKDKGTLARKYQHNYRTGKVPNADPTLLHRNEELVKLGGKTYVEKFDEIITRLKEQNPKIRKNAVLALEIVTTFSREDIETVDVEKWKSDQVKWLRENFNPNPEEFGDNVVSVMFHGDEAGNVHCHSVIIPIDDKGKLEDIEVRGYVEINAQGEYEEYIESEKLNPRLYTALETTIERFVRNHGVFIHPSKENIRGTRNLFRLRIVRCPTTKY